MDTVRHDASTLFSSFTAGSHRALQTRVSGNSLEVTAGGAVLARFAKAPAGAAALRLTPLGTNDDDETLSPLMAALEALFGTDRDLHRIELVLDPKTRLYRACQRLGLGLPQEGQGGLRAEAGMFWQRPEPWLTQPAAAPYPQTHVMDQGVRHPLRPPKPQGTLYARYIPWLGKTLSFRTFDPAGDLERFNRWMNDPRVAAIWEESGDLAAHAAYAAKLAADPHMIPLIACFDNEPFGYFEIYWAKENRLGPYYAADDYDRGWHVLIGEDGFRGRAFVSAWLPSLMHFLFLDEPRTQRIVGEPAARHAQQIRNLERSGFAKVKHVQFPHKKAMLVMLCRERFVDDRLWHPATAEVTA